MGCCAADSSLRGTQQGEKQYAFDQRTCDIANYIERGAISAREKCAYYADIGQCGWVGDDEVDDYGQNICETVAEEKVEGSCASDFYAAGWDHDTMCVCCKFGEKECMYLNADGDPRSSTWLGTYGCVWFQGSTCDDDWECAADAMMWKESEGDSLFKGISEEAETTSAENMRNLLAAALLLIAAVAMYAMYALFVAKGKKSVHGAADERQPLIF